MLQSPNVMVLASDQALEATTVSELARLGCSVRAGVPTRSSPPTLIVRDCRDRRRLDRYDVPVLTVDLSILNGEDLVEVVYRVLGLTPASPAVALSALLLILQGRVPEA
jgi:hypothetical protein